MQVPPEHEAVSTLPSPHAMVAASALRFLRLTKIVAALMVATTAGMFVVLRGMADMIDSASGYSTVDLVAAWMMAIVSLICAYMMWQVQGIAQALVSGGSGANSANFGKGAGRLAAQKVGTGALQVGKSFAAKFTGGSK